MKAAFPADGSAELAARQTPWTAWGNEHLSVDAQLALMK
jgi:hypothetical protein